MDINYPDELDLDLAIIIAQCGACRSNYIVQEGNLTCEACEGELVPIARFDPTPQKQLPQRSRLP